MDRQTEASTAAYTPIHPSDKTQDIADDQRSIETVRRHLNIGELGSFDVFSLVVNKMDGTGIYTSPIRT